MARKPPSPSMLNQLAKLRLKRLRTGKTADDVLINFRCPSCRRNTTIAREVNSRERFALPKFLARGKRVPAYRVRCACGTVLGARDATVMQHDHLFPEAQRDLQLVTWGGEGRLLRRMNLQGASQPLPVDVDEPRLREALGLPMPVEATWQELFARCLETGEASSAMAEDGYALVALPRGEANQSQDALAKVPGGQDFGDRAQVVGLEAPAWAGRFAEEMALGRLRAFAIFDPQEVKARAHRALAASGVGFTESPDGFTLILGELKYDLTAHRVMDVAAESAMDVAEATVAAVEEARQRLRTVADLFEETARLAEGFEVRAEGRMAYVRNPTTGAEEGFDIYEVAGHDDAGDRLRPVLERLVGRLTSRQLPIACACGRPSWVGKHLRSRRWLDGENATVAHRPRGDAVEIYTVECSEHFTPLHQDDLQLAGLGLDELERLWERDLERGQLDLRAMVEGNAQQRMVYVVGPNASDLALHAGLAASLLLDLGMVVDPDHPHVNFYAPTTDSLVLYRDVTFDRLRSAYDRCLELEHRTLGRHGDELNYIGRLLLFDRPRGRLNVTRVSEQAR